MTRQELQPQPQFAHFGEALRYYRTTAPQRIVARQQALNPALPIPEFDLHALTLIKSMSTNGHTQQEITDAARQGVPFYDISSGSYSEMEAGISLPRDPGAFLAAVSPRLGIAKGSDEWVALAAQLGEDIIKRRFLDTSLAEPILDAMMTRRAQGGRRTGPRETES